MNTSYTFNISLSVLNHLGRNLYRSFITILGEAISNAWDADAKRVSITIDRDKSLLIIRDDGIGMTSKDFQDKFLKIGYSKRQSGDSKTPDGRPFIGRKGIGKLALLSCAKKISVITKACGSDWVGGVIDNSSLDKAISDDIPSSGYKLGVLPPSILTKYTSSFITEGSGTILIFEDINEGIRNKIEYIRQQIALSFRFSLLDPSFCITLNEVDVTINDLQELINNTQFLWKINEQTKDEYIVRLEEKATPEFRTKTFDVNQLPISGFIASIQKPSMLTIRGAQEKVSLDLYVNGRLREKDILRHISFSRVVENYLYGQIHYNDLDDEKDRFTSSREGVIPNDDKYKALLECLKEEVMPSIINDWDKWRLELKQDGDPDNTTSLTTRERKSKALFDELSRGFVNGVQPTTQHKIDAWIQDLEPDAKFNLPAYGECFLAENLLRRYIEEQQIPLSSKQNNIEKWRKNAIEAQNKAGISIRIREIDTDIYYYDMQLLSELSDPERDRGSKACLSRDALTYKPMRDAMAHTSRLTKDAQNLLTTTFANIKARLIKLLGSSSQNES